MKDLIREAPLGKVIRYLTVNKWLLYPEEEPGFVLPSQYQAALNRNEKQHGLTNHSSSSNSSKTLPAIEQLTTRPDVESPAERLEAVMSHTQSMRSLKYDKERIEAEGQLDLQRTKSIPIRPVETESGVILVDWYTTDDQSNPQNWSALKRGWVVFVICAYNWVTYIAGSLWVPAQPGIQEHFGVDIQVGSLGLSMFIVGYGIGPLLFGPITEIPIVGRHSVYFLTFLVYFILTIPTASIDSFAGIVVLRFLSGFFGSPAIGIGGASVGDVMSFMYFPYGLGWWILSFWAGPSLGPTVGGFAAMAKGWRWPLWEVVWVSAPMLALLFLCTPETLGSNILLRRAKRLRKLTGDNRLQSQGEIDQKGLSMAHIVKETLLRPMEIMAKDPSIFFTNLYTAYFYATYYTFFSVFDIVFPEFYGFNLGETGNAFLACEIGSVLGHAMYFAYLYFYMVPDNKKNGFRDQEHRLHPAVFGSLGLPIGLFIFAWTADSNIHWSVPLFGVAIFTIGGYLVIQGLFVYIPISYPKYAASLFTGNDLFRSSMAAGSVHFAKPLFRNLGVHDGVTILASIGCLGVVGCWALWYFGARLRAASKFAQA
jgi:DHA1 family multidrug resistance protein-like MFS transporter